jgi:uncharacterized protein (DUF2141 family)
LTSHSGGFEVAIRAQVGRRHTLIVAVARSEQHAMLTESHWLTVAIDRAVGDLVKNGFELLRRSQYAVAADANALIDCHGAARRSL